MSTHREKEMTISICRLTILITALGFGTPLASLFASKLDAQTTSSGGLTGVVSDPSGAVVPDALVELKDTAKGDTQSTRTNAEGEYLYSFLRPGNFTLTVSHPGFKATSRVLSITLGPPATMNVQLALESADPTTVRVTEEAPLIKAENGDVSTTMNQLQVSQVPNPGNDLTYIAQNAPGVIMNTDFAGFTNFSSLGMPGTSNLFTLNGMSDNDLGAGNVNNSGALNLLLGQNEVQEATVVSYGYSGQFGNAAGANVNYITRSGGDAFHGNAAYFWNGRLLNANDWINNATGSPRPFSNANQWAGSLGGPIKRDKLFFFFSTEGIRLVLPFPFTIQLPSPQFQAATLANIDARFGPS